MSWPKGRPRVFTPEHRAKMSAAALGRPKSAAARAAMSLAKKGKPGHPQTPAVKLAVSRARKGKPLSAAHRAKLSAAKLGRSGPWLGKKRTHVLTPEVRARLSAAMMGRPAYFPRKRFYYKDVPFRSSYEVRVAKAFDALGVQWEYESKQFVLSAQQTYRPDFWLPDLHVLWEVKGWFGPQSVATVNLFRTKYPDQQLVVATLPVIETLERAVTGKAA